MQFFYEIYKMSVRRGVVPDGSEEFSEVSGTIP